MSESTAELPTFLVPLQKSNLLVPNATVAEIIPYEPLQRVQDTPDWFLGYLGWRGVQVPVVSFEMLTVDRGSFSLVSVASANLVVMKAMGGREVLDFIAIVAQALPKLNRITEDMLFETGEARTRTELMKVRFGNEIVSIPDLDYVEWSVANVLGLE
ncbi:MAG: chemotaxis protein CheW [Gammaproteobacteria bacterium]|nr:chemotaxis protein CheW [Gammaproteobacteria bacterium]